jgi:hypothetical protein
MLMVFHVFGHCTARFLACPACLDALFHLRIVMLGALFSAQFARLGTRHTSEAHHRALASHQFGGKTAEFLTVHRQLGTLGVLRVAVLEVLEAMVVRLVANRGAVRAGLQAVAVHLVVVMGVFRPGFRPRDGGQPGGSSTQGTKNLSAVHLKLLLKKDEKWD